jgi:type IV secretion system protein VirB5
MKLRKSIVAMILAGTALQARAQLLVNDPAVLAQAVKQVKSWTDQYGQMQAQIDSMTGDRGMAQLLPNLAPYLPADWAQSMTTLTSLAQQIRQSQAVLTPAQAAYLTPTLQQFLSQAQNLSASNQAMAQTAFNDAAARQSRLQVLTRALANARDPKAAYDLANRIAIEHTALLRDQNQLEAAANGASAQDRAQRLMMSQMRAATAGTVIPKIDTSMP